VSQNYVNTSLGEIIYSEFTEQSQPGHQHNQYTKTNDQQYNLVL